MNGILKYNKKPEIVNNSMPEALDGIVLNAMAKRQEDRYEFMEMAKAIIEVVGERNRKK